MTRGYRGIAERLRALALEEDDEGLVRELTALADEADAAAANLGRSRTKPISIRLDKEMIAWIDDYVEGHRDMSRNSFIQRAVAERIDSMGGPWW